VGRRHVEAKLLHQPSQPGGLTLGEVEHQPGQGRGVDDRMLERAFKPATNEPAVESVVAVLDEHRALGETQERPAGVPEFGRTDQHRTIDVVSLLGVRIDGRAAVDERVEEGERAGQLEPLGSRTRNGALPVVSTSMATNWASSRRVCGLRSGASTAISSHGIACAAPRGFRKTGFTTVA
jgi:hypothetical protein